MWTDGGYNAWQVDAAVAKVPLLRMEIVKRSDDMKGFVILPRRWVVERTFSWFGRNRRLAKDFENLAETLATFVTFASISLPLGGSPGSRSISAGRGAPVPLPAANGCCGFGEGTFASTHGNGQDAPIPAVRRQAANLSGSEPTGPCAAGLAGLQMPTGSPQVG